MQARQKSRHEKLLHFRRVFLVNHTSSVRVLPPPPPAGTMFSCPAVRCLSLLSGSLPAVSVRRSLPTSLSHYPLSPLTPVNLVDRETMFSLLTSSPTGHLLRRCSLSSHLPIVMCKLHVPAQCFALLPLLYLYTVYSCALFKEMGERATSQSQPDWHDLRGYGCCTTHLR